LARESDAAGVGRPNGEACAVCAQRDRVARLFIAPLAVDVSAELVPGRAVPLEDPYVTSEVAIAAVLRRANGEAGAVRAQRDRLARLVARRFTVDVARRGGSSNFRRPLHLG